MTATLDRAVLLGIDAGGSTVRARAVAGPIVLWEGVGGAGNPLAVDREELARNYTSALTGCPSPDVVAACVAGVGAAAGRRAVEEILRHRFPRSGVSVLPDYVAAYMSAPGAEVVVIAGTGSVICSRPTAGGPFRVSGGRGWREGDPGSGANLGSAVVDRLRAAPTHALEDALWEALGSDSVSTIEEVLTRSKSPVADLARAAVVLLGAAADGEPWAREALRREMAMLAAAVREHVERWHLGTALEVALVGGIWTSVYAVAAFERELRRRVPATRVRVSQTQPLEGAVRLAGALAKVT